MKFPITRCLAAVVIILSHPQPAAAVYDPRYTCQTLHDEPQIVVDGKPVELRKGTKVRLTFWHYGRNYLPVDIELPGEMFIAAHQGFVEGEVKDLPNDKVLRQSEPFLWVHSPTGSAGDVVEVELDCQLSQ